MPAAVARCLLDQATQRTLLEIINAMMEESETVEIDGEEIELEELREVISSCANKEKRGMRKRGPKAPSAYNRFIGHCRTSPEKGGLGKDFKECVRLWKEQKKP